MDRVGCIFPSFPNKIELVGPGCEKWPLCSCLGFKFCISFLERVSCSQQRRASLGELALPAGRLLYLTRGQSILRLTSAACGHAGAAGQAGDVAGDVAGVHAGAAGQAGDVAGLHADGRTRGGMLLRSA